ncbi:MAG TPA: formylglycine-generating enzyme family protein [Gemmatimonadaceae bacterium]|nr:formylglycine-generating enzyme family protein [Gemmatimonadaceae bacterium]
MRPTSHVLPLLALSLTLACRNGERARVADGAQPDSSRAAGERATARRHPLGEEFDDCAGAAWCPRLIVIPAGSFTMGTPANEPGFSDIEGPQHHVTVRSFAAGKFDVTRGQWAAFASATNRPTRHGCSWTGRTGMKPDPKGAWNDVGFTQDDSHPVVCVTWSDAQDYVRWLTERTGKRYRLLSEAEWEYAARAGTSTAFPWGATASHEHANYGSEKCCSGLALGRDKWEHTSPVGSFPPNAFGLFDMSGNVLQWVQDCMSSTYEGLPVDGSANEAAITLRISGDFADMNGASSCAYRMLRGGDYGDPPVMLRSGFRNFAPPPGETIEKYASAGVGFRVARTIE